MMKHEDVVEDQIQTIQGQLEQIEDKLDTLIDVMREVLHKLP